MPVDALVFDQSPSKDQAHQLQRQLRQKSPLVPYSHKRPQVDLPKGVMWRHVFRYHEKKHTSIGPAIYSDLSGSRIFVYDEVLASYVKLINQQYRMQSSRHSPRGNKIIKYIDLEIGGKRRNLKGGQYLLSALLFHLCAILRQIRL
jgi:hypothetical protein